MTKRPETSNQLFLGSAKSFETSADYLKQTTKRFATFAIYFYDWRNYTRHVLFFLKNYEIVRVIVVLMTNGPRHLEVLIFIRKKLREFCGECKRNCRIARDIVMSIKKISKIRETSWTSSTDESKRLQASACFSNAIAERPRVLKHDNANARDIRKQFGKRCKIARSFLRTIKTHNKTTRSIPAILHWNDENVRNVRIFYAKLIL